MRDHDYFTSENDRLSLAGKLATHKGQSGGSAFSARDMNMESVLDVVVPDDDDKPDDAEKQADGEGNEPEQQGDKASPSKKDGRDGKDGKKDGKDGKFFDRDTHVPAAKRSFSRALELYKTTLDKTTADLKLAVGEAKALPQDIQTNIVSELKVASIRLCWLELVLGTREGDLGEHIRSFSRSMGGSDSLTIGQAPPTRSFASLVTWKTVEALETNFDTVTSVEGVASITEKYKGLKTPLIELNKSAVDAKLKLVKAQEDIKSLEEEKAKIANAEKQEKESASRKKRRMTSLIEAAPQLACQVPVCSTPGDFETISKTMNHSVPLLLATGAYDTKMIPDNADKSLSELLKGMARDLEASRSVPGSVTRGQQKITGDAAKLANEFTNMMALRCWKGVDVLSHPELGGSCDFTAFSMLSKCDPWSAAERGHLACCRYSFSGTREVVLCPEEAIYAFLQIKNPGFKPSFKELWTFFRMMDGPLLQKFIESEAGTSNVFFCTVGPGEVLLVPAAWCVCESVKGSESCVGLRRSYVDPEDAQAGKRLRAVMQELSPDGTSQTLTCLLLKQAIEVITGSDEPSAPLAIGAPPSGEAAKAEAEKAAKAEAAKAATEEAEKATRAEAEKAATEEAERAGTEEAEEAEKSEGAKAALAKAEQIVKDKMERAARELAAKGRRPQGRRS